MWSSTYYLDLDLWFSHDRLLDDDGDNDDDMDWFDVRSSRLIIDWRRWPMIDLNFESCSTDLAVSNYLRWSCPDL